MPEERTGGVEEKKNFIYGLFCVFENIGMWVAPQMSVVRAGWYRIFIRKKYADKNNRIQLFEIIKIRKIKEKDRKNQIEANE